MRELLSDKTAVSIAKICGIKYPKISEQQTQPCCASLSLLDSTVDYFPKSST